MQRKLILLLATFMCIFLCACGGSESTSGENTDTKTEVKGNTSLSKTEKEVEITMDNWQEYFEFIEVVCANENYNAFDELASVSYPYHYCLTIKEEYEIDIEKSNVAIEINGHSEYWSVNIDKDTLEISYIEKTKDGDSFNRVSEFKKLNLIFEEQLDRELYYGVKLTPEGDPYIINFNEETQVGTMFRHFLDEVVRIQGTIYIKEK